MIAFIIDTANEYFGEYGWVPDNDPDRLPALRLAQWWADVYYDRDFFAGWSTEA